MTLEEEQKLLKEEFLKAAENSFNQTDAEAAAEAKDLIERDSGFLKQRQKTAAELEKEENEYRAFLKQQEERSKHDAAAAKEAEILRSYWLRDDLDENEKFLREYILNKGWIDKDKNAVPTYEELVSLHNDDVDEVAVEQQEEYEYKYNFRFEEPGGTLIHTYPRNIEDSARKKDNKRAEKRKKVKERKAKEKKQQEDEKKRFLKLKKQEIMERLERIQKATGVDAEKLAKFNLTDEMDNEWDPQKYDETMKNVFDEEYYQENEERKPVFDDDLDAELNKEENYDQSLAKQELDKKRAELQKSQQNPQSSNEQNKNEGNKTFKDYLDEYYRLDYEDVIAGDIKCRFKYIQVPATTYGLSIAEILEKEDRELNAHISLKKLAPYRPDRGLVQPRRWRRRKGTALKVTKKPSREGEHDKKETEPPKKKQKVETTTPT
jgi:protein KRI1